MVRLVIAAAALTLSACGTNDTDRAYAIGFSQGVSGNAAYVTISNVWKEADALPLAETHCGKYGKIARFRYIERYRATFDCVRDT